MVVDLDVDGTMHMVDPARDPEDHLRGSYLHIDFLEVRRDEKVKMSIEIHEVGEAPGVKTGGVIEHHLREVEIECLPGDVPEQHRGRRQRAGARRHAARRRLVGAGGRRRS